MYCLTFVDCFSTWLHTHTHKYTHTVNREILKLTESRTFVDIYITVHHRWDTAKRPHVKVYVVINKFTGWELRSVLCLVQRIHLPSQTLCSCVRNINTLPRGHISDPSLQERDSLKGKYVGSPAIALVYSFLSCCILVVVVLFSEQENKCYSHTKQVIWSPADVTVSVAAWRRNAAPLTLEC